MSFIPTFMEKFYPHLNAGQFKRAETFKRAIEFLEADRSSSYTIVETGITRSPGNWGDGQSTVIWDAFLDYHGDGGGYSIDINETYVTNARKFLTRMNAICGDSVYELSKMPEIISLAKLVYLDSFDLDTSNPIPSALHHLMELTAIYGRLRPGTLVMVDDCVSDIVGKHIHVKNFMDRIGARQLFAGYQCGWVI